MKKKFQQSLKRFWFPVLLLLSLVLSYGAYQLILKNLFPAFTSVECAIQEHECSASYLEGYVGLLTLVLVIGGLVFAAWEYFRQESQISFQIYESIHKKMTDPAEEAARRWIITNIRPYKESDSIKAWSKEFATKIYEKPNDWDEKKLAPGHQHIKRTLNALDYFGFVAENYVNVEGPLLEWMSPPIAKVWERIAPYVERERDARNEPDFYKSASYIGKKCLEWRTKKGLKSEIIDSGI